MLTLPARPAKIGGAFNHELTITSETWGSQGEIELGGAE